MLDLDVGGVYFTLRAGKLPNVLAIRRAVEESGFEVAAVQVAIRGTVVRSSSRATRVVLHQNEIQIKDPRRLLDRALRSFPNGAEVTLRGVLDTAHGKEIFLDICGVDSRPARNARESHEVTLPLCR